MRLMMLFPIMLCLFFVSPACTNASNISLFVNGTQVYADVAPDVEGRDVLLPLRVVAEAVGAAVFYDELWQTVYINRYDLVVEIPIGKYTGLRNGRTILLAAPPRIINGRTFISREALKNALGLKAIFNSHTNCVYVE